MECHPVAASGDAPLSAVSPLKPGRWRDSWPWRAGRPGLLGAWHPGHPASVTSEVPRPAGSAESRLYLDRQREERE